MGFPPALPPERTWFPLVELAIGEDIGAGDATTPLVVEAGRQGAAIIEARQPLVVCGLEIAFAVFREIDPQLELRAQIRDGERAEPGGAGARRARGEPGAGSPPCRCPPRRRVVAGPVPGPPR